MIELTRISHQKKFIRNQTIPGISVWCLNNLTCKDSYPLLHTNEALDYVAGFQWSSSLCLHSGYWQVELTLEAWVKTAFSIGQGLWQFLSMPFGLCNAPATFERLIEKVLAYTWMICLCTRCHLTARSLTSERCFRPCEGQIFASTPKSATCFSESTVALYYRRCCHYR